MDPSLSFISNDLIGYWDYVYDKSFHFWQLCKVSFIQINMITCFLAFVSGKHRESRWTGVTRGSGNKEEEVNYEERFFFCSSADNSLA